MVKQPRITPNVRGYIAGMLDLKGNAYNSKSGELTVYINGVKDPQMQRDLVSWVGGGHIRETFSEGDRRGCKQHCDIPHFHYTLRSVRYILTGYRAAVLLYNLEASLFTWADKFQTPFLVATEGEIVGASEKVAKDMIRRGWDVGL